MKMLESILMMVMCDVILGSKVNPHQVLDAASSAIGITVLECKKEVRFSDQVIPEFLSYWDPQHELTLKEMGCVVFCVLIKLQLMGPEGVLRTENAAGFGKANGADDEMIKSLSSVYETCRHSFNFTEPCASGLKLANCFRDKVFELQWAPSVGAHYYDTEF